MEDEDDPFVAMMNRNNNNSSSGVLDPSKQQQLEALTSQLLNAQAVINGFTKQIQDLNMLNQELRNGKVMMMERLILSIYLSIFLSSH